MNKKEEIQSIVKSAIEDYCIIMSYDIIANEDGMLYVGTNGKPFMFFYTVIREDHYFVLFEIIVLIKVLESRKDKIETFIESEDMSTYLEENYMSLQFDDENNLSLSYHLYQEDKIEKVLKSKSILIADHVEKEGERFRGLIEDAVKNK